MILLIGAGLILTLLALVVDRRTTRIGELAVRSDHPSFRLTIRQNGRDIHVGTDRRFFELPSGQYDLALEAPPSGLALDTEHVTIDPSRRAVVRVIESSPSPAPAPEPARPEPDRTPPPAVASAPSIPVEKPGLLKTFSLGIGSLEGVAVTPDGKLALVCGVESPARIWDLEHGVELKVLAQDASSYAVAIRPDGALAATAGGDGVVRLWELPSGAPKGELKGHGRKVNTLAFATGGSRLLSGGDDGTARVWTLENQTEIARMIHDGPVFAVAFASGGRVALSAGADRTVRLWNPDTGAESSRLPEPGNVLALAVSPSGNHVLTGSEDGRVTLWNLDQRRALNRLEGNHDDWVRTVAFHADGGHALAGYQNGRLVVWNTALNNPSATFDNNAVGHLSLALLPDGTHALTADFDGKLRLWHIVVETK